MLEEEDIFSKILDESQRNLPDIPEEIEIKNQDLVTMEPKSNELKENNGVKEDNKIKENKKIAIKQTQNSRSRNKRIKVLPPGCIQETKYRLSGPQKGKSYHEYLSPDGKRFQSFLGLQRALGIQDDFKPKIDNIQNENQKIYELKNDENEIKKRNTRSRRDSIKNKQLKENFKQYINQEGSSSDHDDIIHSKNNGINELQDHSEEEIEIPEEKEKLLLFGKLRKGSTLWKPTKKKISEQTNHADDLNQTNDLDIQISHQINNIMVPQEIIEDKKENSFNSILI